MLDQAFHILLGNDAISGLAIFGASLVEYLFPPFPGDTVVLFGAFLAATGRLNLVLLMAASAAGSMLGALCDFYIGQWVKHKRDPGSDERKRSGIDLLVGRFRRHGAAYMAVNRFFPGIRALFFVAAGMAGLRPRAVLFWAGVSALLWNSLLIAAGYLVGESWERFRALVAAYRIVAELAVIIVLIGIAVWMLHSFLSRRKKEG